MNISYKYNESGLRTKKISGNTTTEYTYVGGTLLQQTDGTNTLSFAYDAGSVRGFKLNNSADYYYLRNLQGDIVGIYDDQGNIVCRYTYDAWGNVISVKDSGGTSITSATHIANLNPIRYRGYYYDTETKLYYLQTRYYNPEWGRFLNADSLFVAGAGLVSSNMFAYCGNNPVMGSDPSGMDAEADVLRRANALEIAAGLLMAWVFVVIISGGTQTPDIGEMAARALADAAGAISEATMRAAVAITDIFAVNPAKQAHNEIYKETREHPTWYWRATRRYVTIGKNKLEYVLLTGALTSVTEAAEYVDSGGSVFAGSRVAALELAKRCKKYDGSDPQIDKNKKVGYSGDGCYYWHYHAGASHIWFL